MNADWFFYLFAAVMILAAGLVVVLRHPVYSVLSLLLSMFCMAGLFVLLGAYFVAAIQILVYAGAILVLFLFVTMLLDVGRDTITKKRQHLWPIAAVVIGVGALTQIGAVIRTVQHAPASLSSAAGSTEHIGKLLFTEYLLPFELVSFLLLAAIIGAVVLSRQQLR